MREKIRIAIHQPNFLPWYPFFYKMAMCDYFVILDNVQFEKNGYQNRCRHKEQWLTKPIHQGTEIIKDKRYADGSELLSLNMQWINAIKMTLSIKTEILMASSYYLDNKIKYDDPTDKLISIIEGVTHKDRLAWGQKFSPRQPVYVTNPEAKDKYLNEQKMRSRGIEIEYCKVPKNLQKSTFEILEKFGIEGAIKNLPKYNIIPHSEVKAYTDDYRKEHVESSQMNLKEHNPAYA